MTGYRYRTRPSAAWRERVCDGTVLLTGMRTFQLANDRTHTLEVQARNVHGWGPSAAVAVTPAAPANAAPAPTERPPAPSGVTATGGDGRIALSWTAPGTAVVMQYRYRLRVPGGEWGERQSNPCASGAVGGMTLTGLDAGTTYDVQLQARNAVGWGAYATISATTAPPAPAGLAAAATPGAPSGLEATAVGDRTAWLSWTDPGDAGVTGYRYRTNPLAAWRERVCDGVALLTGMRAPGMTNGKTYRLELQARNAYGWGPSAAVAVTPVAPATATPAPTERPPAPSGVTAAGGDRRIALSWTAPGAVVGLEYRYRLRAAGGTWGEPQHNRCTREAAGGMTLIGLDAGTTYDVRLFARNAAGVGTYATISATTAPPALAGGEADAALPPAPAAAFTPALSGSLQFADFGGGSLSDLRGALLAGCSGNSVAVYAIADSRWVGFVPGSRIEAVNAAFRTAVAPGGMVPEGTRLLVSGCN